MNSTPRPSRATRIGPSPTRSSRQCSRTASRCSSISPSNGVARAIAPPDGRPIASRSCVRSHRIRSSGPFAVDWSSDCTTSLRSGSCMDEKPADGVVNPLGQGHDIADLLVSDGSRFTTNAAENPTLTIVALAIRQADCIEKRMSEKAIRTPTEEIVHLQGPGRTGSAGRSCSVSKPRKNPGTAAARYRGSLAPLHRCRSWPSCTRSSAIGGGRGSSSCSPPCCRARRTSRTRPTRAEAGRDACVASGPSPWRQDSLQHPRHGTAHVR